MNPSRVRKLNTCDTHPGPVVYLMERDQRTRDHWALHFAQNLALQYQSPLAVLFRLKTDDRQSTLRHYDFMLQGLRTISEDLAKRNIAFFVLGGKGIAQITRFVTQNRIKALVTDFNPLRPYQRLRQQLGDNLQIPVFEVDAHNIVPCWIASAKKEFAAYSFRPKIEKHLSTYCTPFPKNKKHPYPWPSPPPPIDWHQLLARCQVDRSVAPVDWLMPGERAAKACLRRFLQHRLAHYADRRNDPNQTAQSDLSPYLHFGHICAQTIALALQKVTRQRNAKDAFLEELVVRKELSDNYCYHTPHYDSFRGFHPWAQHTLNEHRHDPREYRYNLITLENAATHDTLWNAAQNEMRIRGKMHGFMRMCWAKKILEWSKHPETALKTAQILNDKYELDGYDPILPGPLAASMTELGPRAPCLEKSGT